MLPEAFDERALKTYSLLMPLPEIPPKPDRPTYPAPWLHGIRCRPLMNLYARFWRVYAVPWNSKPQHLYLGKHMFFASQELAREFQQRIETFMEKTKVRCIVAPDIVCLANPLFQHHGRLDRKENQLFYATNTHSAVTRDPQYIQRRKQTQTPGVTAFDVRIAIRVEELWDEWFSQRKAILPPPGTVDFGIEVGSIVGFGLRCLQETRSTS